MIVGNLPVTQVGVGSTGDNQQILKGDGVWDSVPIPDNYVNPVKMVNPGGVSN